VIVSPELLGPRLLFFAGLGQRGDRSGSAARCLCSCKRRKTTAWEIRRFRETHIHAQIIPDQEHARTRHGSLLGRHECRGRLGGGATPRWSTRAWELRSWERQQRSVCTQHWCSFTISLEEATWVPAASTLCVLSIPRQAYV